MILSFLCTIKKKKKSKKTHQQFLIFFFSAAVRRLCPCMRVHRGWEGEPSTVVPCCWAECSASRLHWAGLRLGYSPCVSSSLHCSARTDAAVSLSQRPSHAGTAHTGQTGRWLTRVYALPYRIPPPTHTQPSSDQSMHRKMHTTVKSYLRKPELALWSVTFVQNDFFYPLLFLYFILFFKDVHNLSSYSHVKVTTFKLIIWLLKFPSCYFLPLNSAFFSLIQDETRFTVLQIFRPCENYVSFTRFSLPPAGEPRFFCCRRWRRVKSIRLERCVTIVEPKASGYDCLMMTSENIRRNLNKITGQIW